MSIKEKICGLFKKKEEAKSTFVITFRHSTKNIEFEGTWKEVKGLFGRFAGGKGLKMNNFFVPWDEVAFIYEEPKKEAEPEGKEGEGAGSKPAEEATKAGDEIPATREAKALGAETMEVLGEAKEEPKDAKIDEVKATVEEEKKVEAEKIEE